MKTRHDDQLTVRMGDAAMQFGRWGRERARAEARKRHTGKDMEGKQGGSRGHPQCTETVRFDKATSAFCTVANEPPSRCITSPVLDSTTRELVMSITIGWRFL